MYSRFPLSMENIPRQKSFACLSLKFGCIVSSLIIIVYSVLLLVRFKEDLVACADFLDVGGASTIIMFALMVTVTISHTVTMLLTVLMLVGTLLEKPHLMRPWVVWSSVQVMVYLMLFVYWTTMSFVSHAGGSSILMYTLEFVSLMLRFYMLMLVASYYKQLEEEGFEGERLKTLVNQDTHYNSA